MPYCSALENHMCITVDSRWRPCCRYQNFENFSIDEWSFDAYRSTEWYHSIKLDQARGWNPGCNKCQAEEARGAVSLRNIMNEQHRDQPGVQSFEISLSNKCNLACRMCGPVYSSFWGKLLAENPSLNAWQHAKPIRPIDVESVFAGVDVKNLTLLKYLGGEPFITPEIGQLFEYLDQQGVIEQLELVTNTNCTLFPHKWTDYLKRFRKVTLEMSIDGVGPVNDYIRYGKPWSLISKNIDEWTRFRDQNSNIEVSSYTTVQALNLHNIGEIVQMAARRGYKYHASLLVVPEHLAVHVLPAAYLEQIRDEHNQRYYASIQDHSRHWPAFVQYNRDFDQATGVSMKSAAPRLWEYMEKHNGQI
jgi:MoaA/NifB/PqqE/SkfB family radical SAM enzyme